MQKLPDAPTTLPVGILVFGDNHLILRGPAPEREQATALVRQWSVIRIGSSPPDTRWTIVNKWFRDRLDWAVIAPGTGARNPAVTQLLEELQDRGIRIIDYST